MIYIRPTTIDDVCALANNMRPEDRREIAQMTGQDAYWAAQHSFKSSELALSGFSPAGELLLMFGAMRDNLLDDTAIIWSLATNAIRNNKLHFIHQSKIGFDMIAKAMPDVGEFHNWISLENRSAIRFVERLGGQLAMRSQRRGLCGGVFNEFYILNPYSEGN